MKRFKRKPYGGRRGKEQALKHWLGEGERWEAIRWLYQRSCERLGYNRRSEDDESGRNEPKSTFRRPSAQLRLFD